MKAFKRKTTDDSFWTHLLACMMEEDICLSTKHSVHTHVHTSPMWGLSPGAVGVHLTMWLHFLWNPRDLAVWIMHRIRSHNEAREGKKPKGKDRSHSDLIRQRGGHEKIKIETALCLPIDNWHQKVLIVWLMIWSLCCELGCFLSRRDQWQDYSEVNGNQFKKIQSVWSIFKQLT